MELDPLGSIESIGEIDCHAGTNLGIPNPRLQKPPINPPHMLAA